MRALCRALAGRALGVCRLRSSCAAPGSACKTASRSGWHCAQSGVARRVALESASRAARRARRAHGRAFARDPDAYWNGGWDSSGAEAFAGSDEDDDEDDGSLESQDVWAEWMNRVSETALHAATLPLPLAALTLATRLALCRRLLQDGFAQPLLAAQTISLQGTRALQQFAEIWVDALLVLLPTAVPRQTARAGLRAGLDTPAHRTPALAGGAARICGCRLCGALHGQSAAYRACKSRATTPASN